MRFWLQIKCLIMLLILRGLLPMKKKSIVNIVSLLFTTMLMTTNTYATGYDLDTEGRKPLPAFECADDEVLSAEGSADEIISAERGVVYPSAYDARTYGLVTSVKSQGNYGTCWCFAKTAQIETSIIKSGLANNTLDLSEAYFLYRVYATDFQNTKTYTDLLDGNVSGASYSVDYNIRMFGSGPVYEKDFPYSEVATFKATDMNTHEFEYASTVYGDAKDKILTTGSVPLDYYSYSEYYKDINGDTSFYMPYKMNGSSSTNHAVLCVGWDDNYPATNFVKTPAGNGAWLCKNSWGAEGYWTSQGSGYYWISYYDPNIEFESCMTFASNGTFAKSLTLSKTYLNMEDIDDPIQITTTVLPDSVPDKNCIFASDNTAVATVDSDGYVTPVGAGKCKITVTTKDGRQSKECSITVKHIDREAKSLTVSNHYLYHHDGHIDLCDDDAYVTVIVQPSEYRTYTASLENNNIADLQKAGNKLYIKRKAYGQTTLHIETDDGKLSKDIPVKNEPRMGAVEDVEMEVEVGQTYQLPEFKFDMDLAGDYPAALADTYGIETGENTFKVTIEGEYRILITWDGWGLGWFSVKATMPTISENTTSEPISEPDPLPYVEPIDNPEPLPEEPSSGYTYSGYTPPYPSYADPQPEPEPAKTTSHYVKSGGVTYKRTGNTYTVWKVSNKKNITIKDKINGKKVTKIRSGAFNGCKKLKKVKISKYIKKVPNKITKKLKKVLNDGGKVTAKGLFFKH